MLEIKEYFKKYKIRIAMLRDGKLIEYGVKKNKLGEEKLSSWREIDDNPTLKKYLQDNNKTSLTWEELFGTSYWENFLESCEEKKPTLSNESSYVFFTFVF